MKRHYEANVNLFVTQEYEGLVESSQQYQHLDNPIYRVCIERALNAGATILISFLYDKWTSTAGYVKVRCVDDPSTFSVSKSVSPNEQPSSIHEEEEEDDDVSELKVKPIYQVLSQTKFILYNVQR